MTGTIIPLRPRGGGQFPLARLDLNATELLVTGRSVSLQAARLQVILDDLREQRHRLAMLFAELRGRTPSGDTYVDAANAELIAAINQGVVQIDLFIARAAIVDGRSDGSQYR